MYYEEHSGYAHTNVDVLGELSWELVEVNWIKVFTLSMHMKAYRPTPQHCACNIIKNNLHST